MDGIVRSGVEMVEEKQGKYRRWWWIRMTTMAEVENFGIISGVGMDMDMVFMECLYHSGKMKT